MAQKNSISTHQAFFIRLLKGPSSTRIRIASSVQCLPPITYFTPLLENKFLYNAYNDLHNRQKTALVKSNQLQTQKHDFPHCSTNAKTIVRTNQPPPHLLLHILKAAPCHHLLLSQRSRQHFGQQCTLDVVDNKNPMTRLLVGFNLQILSLTYYQIGTEQI